MAGTQSEKNETLYRYLNWNNIVDWLPTCRHPRTLSWFCDIWQPRCIRPCPRGCRPSRRGTQTSGPGWPPGQFCLDRTQRGAIIFHFYYKISAAFHFYYRFYCSKWQIQDGEWGHWLSPIPSTVLKSVIAHWRHWCGMIRIRPESHEDWSDMFSV